MPPRKGNESVTISLPAELVERLTKLASRPGSSRSKVLEDAFRAQLEGSASETLLEGLYHRMDEYGARLAAVEQTLNALGVQLTAMHDLLRTQGKASATLADAANLLYDYVDGAHGKPLPPGSRLRAFFGW